MNRMILTAVAVGTLFFIADSASAQYRGRACSSLRGANSVRYYGSISTASRHYVPGSVARRDHFHTRSSHYRIEPVRRTTIYHGHGGRIHSHSRRQVVSPYGYGYRPNGVSINIRF